MTAVHLQRSSVNDIVLGLTPETDKTVRNNAGGVFNHLIYFKVCFTPCLSTPVGLKCALYQGCFVAHAKRGL